MYQRQQLRCFPIATLRVTVEYDAPGLKSLNLRIGFVSNWDLRLRNLLAELGLLDLADAVVISAELVSEKPDPLLQAACG
jgi:FMN phosphatase YigB (HAD superfamily)